MRFYPLNFSASFYAFMFLLLILRSSDVNAQQNANTVKGVVTDNNGDPLSGVSVIIRNTKTNYTSGTSTDSSGTFTFSRVAPGGPYSFTFSNVGFENQTMSGYNIREGNPLSLDVK
ncbi:MAG: carboxypeptidase-like regulatory domain-containing protein, partial [Segetibacter sp.]